LKQRPQSVPSRRRLNYPGFSAAPVKNEGEAIAFDNAQEAYTSRYNHETIALGFAITEEAMEDNLYDSLSARYTKALARAMAYTKQVKAANILNQGFDSCIYWRRWGSVIFNRTPIWYQEEQTLTDQLQQLI
jgi:hypothetical protein